MKTRCHFVVRPLLFTLDTVDLKSGSEWSWLPWLINAGHERPPWSQSAQTQILLLGSEGTYLLHTPVTPPKKWELQQQLPDGHGKNRPVHRRGSSWCSAGTGSAWTLGWQACAPTVYTSLPCPEERWVGSSLPATLAPLQATSGALWHMHC